MATRITCSRCVLECSFIAGLQFWKPCFDYADHLDSHVTLEAMCLTELSGLPPQDDKSPLRSFLLSIAYRGSSPYLAQKSTFHVIYLKLCEINLTIFLPFFSQISDSKLRATLPATLLHDEHIIHYCFTGDCNNNSTVRI